MKNSIVELNMIKREHRKNDEKIKQKKKDSSSSEKRKYIQTE